MNSSIPTSTLEKFSTFGDLLRYLRRRSGLTQTELSIAVGYSTAQISRLEQNLRPPDLPTLEARFLEALGLEHEQEAAARLLDLAANVRREDAPAPGLCPYKGLSYFDEADADLFVGREALTAKLTGRVLSLVSPTAAKKDQTASRFLAVVGASGSGKSSLVRAGMVPALHWDKASADWRIAVLTPTARPLESLAAGLTPEGGSVAATAALIDDLTRDPRSLHLLAKRESKSEDGSRLVLVVDQFEELFALCRSEEERAAFIDNLLTAASEAAGPTVVVITLRADFYAYCAGYPQLREALAGQQEYIGAMSGVELRRAIEEPARRGRWEFEPGLVDVLLHDVGHEPGALPLLSHALLETWQRRRGRTMTLSGYASSGGVRGAIAETAEAVFTDQFTHEQQEIARRIFLRLTELGDETATGDTRRRATFDELILKPEEAETTRTVLKALADARLITTSEDSAEVSHEALIREWPTLRGWLEDNREGLRLHRQLTEAAQDWVTAGRDPDLLYRGARLAHVRDWAERHTEDLNPLEHEFLDASVEEGEREALEREAQRQRELEAAQRLAEEQSQRAAEQVHATGRLRRRAYLLAGALALAILLAGVAAFFGNQANRNAASAQESALTAQENESAALNSQATAQAEAQARSTQQAIAESNFSRAEAERLAAVAKGLLLQGGNIEAAALLAIRSLNQQYSAQGDEALVAVSVLDFPTKQFVGHTDRVKAVDFSPDGRYVLTGAADSVVRLWDLQTGEEIRQLSGDMQDVNSAVFSPDSQFILTGSRFDHTVRLWDVETGEEIRRFSEGNAGTFSLDGQMIFVFSEDNRDSAMIDLNSGEVLHTIPAPQQYRRPENTGYSPDGRLFVDVPEDEGSLHIREVGSGDEILRVPVSLDAFDTFTFSPDNRYFAVTNDNDTDFDVIQVWELATGELAQTLENESRPMALAFSPDSRLIASGGYGPDVRVWDVQTGEMVRDLRAHHALGTRKIAFSPDARYLMSGGFDRRALLWDLAAGGGVPELVEKAYREAPPLAMSPDGSLLAGNAPEGPLVVWDAATGEHRGQFQADQIPVWQVAFTWDNALLLTMSDRMRTWDVRQGALLHEFDPALTEDRGISATRTLGTLAVSPQYVLAAHEGNDEWTGGAIAWDARTGEEVRRFTAPMGAQTIFVSPDAKLLATYNIADHQARIFDIATGQEIHVFPVENSSAGALAFSPDSRVLFTGGDVVSALWDLNTGEQLHEIVGPREVVGDAAFSHDGSYVVTGSADNTVQIWDTLTGRELRRVTEPPDYGVFGLSQDDQYWFMASDDRLYILDTHIEDAVNRLCARLLRDFTAEEREQYQIPDEEPTCPAEP